MNLNIGLFNDSFPPTIDGVANAVKNYAEIITENFGTATVVTPKYPNIVDNYDYEVYRYMSLPVEKLIGGYRAGVPFLSNNVFDLRKKKFDLIHLHCPFASALLVHQVQRFNKKVPVVFTYHTKFDIDIAARIGIHQLQYFAKKFVYKNINKCDEVWVVSEGAVKSLRALGYKNDYRVMENGTDFPLGRVNNEEVTALKRKHGIKDNETVLLFVGRMHWYKNIRLIIDTLKALKNRGFAFKMIFAGSGTDLEEIQKYVKTLELSDFVIFLGAIYDREELRKYFCVGDLFFFPSTYDTSGIVVKEAAACSIPSVLISESCASEGVKDGITGFLTKENVEDCCRTIISASVSKQKLSEVGMGAKNHVYLSWDEAVAKAYTRYEEIVEMW